MPIVTPNALTGILEHYCVSELISKNLEEEVFKNISLRASYVECKDHPMIAYYHLRIIDRTINRDEVVIIRLSFAKNAFTLSHRYKSGNSISAYHSSKEGHNCGDVCNALMDAASALFLYYKLGDDQSTFVKSKNFK